MEKRIIISIALILIHSVFTDVVASAGMLDATFNPSGTPPGTVVTVLGFLSNGNAVALQSDGKIVVAGSSQTGSSFETSEFAVTRYTTDGSLDSSFGTGGTVTTAIGTFAVGSGLVIQPDGSIVVAGSAFIDMVQEFVVARYTSAGVLDATFGTGGIVTTEIGTAAQGLGVVLQSDGSIVVAGYGTPGSAQEFAVVRYTSGGGLDATFGTGGIVTTPIGTSAAGSAVALQQDEKIIVVGQAVVSVGQADFAVARYTTDGSLDTTFGSGGVVTTAISTDDQARSVVVQPDGNIVVAGTTFTGSVVGVALVRYTPTGAVDTSFANDGIVVTNPPGSILSEPDSVILQPDGKILVGGEAQVGTISDNIFEFLLMRYTPAGALDTSFGNGGIVETIVPTGSTGESIINGLALQPDGKIVATGLGTPVGSASPQLAVARYLGASAITNACAVRLIEKYGSRLTPVS